MLEIKFKAIFLFSYFIVSSVYMFKSYSTVLKNQFDYTF